MRSSVVLILVFSGLNVLASTDEDNPVTSTNNIGDGGEYGGDEDTFLDGLLARAASTLGQSSLASQSNAQQDEPASFKSASPPSGSPPPWFSNAPSTHSSPGATPVQPDQQQQQSAAGIVRDPERGLAFLEYIKFLLETYPRVDCTDDCDLSRFRRCTCVSPSMYTHDGRGNCNVGATRIDTRVWCYVSDKFGDPRHVCPDSRQSSSRPGYYWSRFACITE